jgi:hypothetical protein
VSDDKRIPLLEFNHDNFTGSGMTPSWVNQLSCRPLNLPNALTHDEVRSGLVQARLTIESQIIPIGVQKVRLEHMVALDATLLQDGMRLPDKFSRSEHVWVVDWSNTIKSEVLLQGQAISRSSKRA